MNGDAPRTAAVAGLVLALLLAVFPAAAQTVPRSGRYQARPAALLACGGISGVCDHRILEGWIEIEVIGPPVVGGPSFLRITDAELRLFGPGGGVQPFPPSDTVQLTELVPSLEDGRRVLTGSSEPSGSSARLEVIPPPYFDPSDRFLLTGTYSEGCCDRYGYDLGYVLFEHVADGGSPLRLLGGRFEVEVSWRDHQGGEGNGVAVPLGDRSARFWFFRADNPELLVKVLPACTPFGHNWFFAAGLTDVGVTIRVTDTLTGVEQVYENPRGRPFAPIQDTTSFPCE